MRKSKITRLQHLKRKSEDTADRYNPSEWDPERDKPDNINLEQEHFLSHEVHEKSSKRNVTPRDKIATLWQSLYCPMGMNYAG